MKLLHITDIHLDHLGISALPVYVKKTNQLHTSDDFCGYYNDFCQDNGIDAILISGDISTCQHLEEHLGILKQKLKVPIYFVLGNHDFYGDDKIIGGNSAAIAEKLSTDSFVYLTAKKECLMLSDKVAIVGADGWYDGGYASFEGSDLMMTDFIVIKEVKETYLRHIMYLLEKKLWTPGYLNETGMIYQYHTNEFLPGAVKALFKETATKFADVVYNQVQDAVAKNAKEIIVVTHIPPFPENSIYKGKMSDKNWMPYFSNAAMGDVLLELAITYKDVNFKVFCGHSHGDAENIVFDNLVCYTTPADYKVISRGRVIEI